MHHLKSLSCKDAGMECDFHVCDKDESEVIAAGQDHARRAHGKEISATDIKKFVKSGAEATCPA